MPKFVLFRLLSDTDGACKTSVYYSSSSPKRKEHKSFFPRDSEDTLVLRCFKIGGYCISERACIDRKIKNKKRSTSVVSPCKSKSQKERKMLLIVYPRT